MKRYVTFSILTLLLCHAVSATTLNLTIDQEAVKPGEQVKIHFDITPTEPVGGQLVVYRREGDKLVVVKKLFTKPLPGTCYACTMDVPLQEDYSEDFVFWTEALGNYSVKANFGGVQKHVDFTVALPVTTTSVTTTSTSSTVTTSTMTTTSTEPTTTVVEVKAPEKTGFVARILSFLGRLLNF